MLQINNMSKLLHSNYQQYNSKVAANLQFDLLETQGASHGWKNKNKENKLGIPPSVLT